MSQYKLCYTCAETIRTYNRTRVKNDFCKFHEIIFKSYCDAYKNSPLDCHKIMITFLSIINENMYENKTLLDFLIDFIKLLKPQEIDSQNVYTKIRMYLFKYNFVEDREINENDNIEHVNPQFGCKNSNDISKCTKVFDPFNMLYLDKYVNCLRGISPYSVDKSCSTIEKSGCSQNGVCINPQCSNKNTQRDGKIAIYKCAQDKLLFEPELPIGKYFIGSKLLYANIIYGYNDTPLNVIYEWISNLVISPKINEYYEYLKNTFGIKYDFFLPQNIRNLFESPEHKHIYIQKDIPYEKNISYVIDEIFKTSKIGTHSNQERLLYINKKLCLMYYKITGEFMMLSKLQKINDVFDLIAKLYSFNDITNVQEIITALSLTKLIINGGHVNYYKKYLKYKQKYLTLKN